MKTGKRIQSIAIKQAVDTDPDTSYLGEYSNNADSEFAIDRRHSTTCPVNTHCNDNAIAQLERIVNYLWKLRAEIGNDSDHVYYYGIDDAVNMVAEIRGELEEDCDCDELGDMERNEYRYFNSSDNYTGELPEDRRKYTLQDYARAESLNRGDWYYIGIRAVADVVIGGVCQTLASGGLWGIESDSGEDYLAEVGRDELAELKKVLYDLGFSKRAIATACKSVKTKDE